MVRKLFVIAVAGLAAAQFLSDPSAEAAEKVTSTDGLLVEADALRTNKEYLAAAGLYLKASRMGGVPRASQAAVRAGECYEKSGKWSEAMGAYDAAVNSGSMDWWATAALYRKSAICAKQGCPDRALETVRLLQAQAPDTSQSLQAGILEDELNGRDPTRKRQLYMRELQACKLYDSAVATHKRDAGTGLELLDAVVREYPDTPAAMRAMESKAHLLSKAGRPDESARVFESIIGQFGPASPNSRIVLTAKTRLAALYNTTGQKAEALRLCDEVLKSGDSPLTPRAGLTSAGAQFELLQHGNDSPDKWDRVLGSCKTVKGSRFCTAADRTRAGTITVETLCWQGKSAEAVGEAKTFLQQAEVQAFPQDVATVLFFAGEELQKLGRYEEALSYYRQVLQIYRGQKEIWPGMDHLPRTGYRIWETLRLAKASPGEISAAARYVVTSFPDSAYASRVKLVTQMEGGR